MEQDINHPTTQFTIITSVQIQLPKRRTKELERDEALESNL